MSQYGGHDFDKASGWCLRCGAVSDHQVEYWRARPPEQLLEEEPHG